jgi:putative transposase
VSIRRSNEGVEVRGEQIRFALRQADSVTPVADVCRQLGVTEVTFYIWKRKYGV